MPCHVGRDLRRVPASVHERSQAQKACRRVSGRHAPGQLEELCRARAPQLELRRLKRHLPVCGDSHLL